MLSRNAYLPVVPRIAARWGALSALVGGLLGVAYSVAFTVAINGSTPDGPAWWDSRYTGQILFLATFLSVLGIFGLYATLVAHSGRPDRLALAGAAFGVLSTTAILVQKAFTTTMMAGWLRPGGEDYPWWIRGMQISEVLGMGACVVALLFLGVSAYRTRLFGSLRALPFVVAALWPASIALLIVLNMARIDRFSWLSGTLPFLGAAFSGWVLLRNHPADHR
jgi:hypothetical protein